MKATFHAFSALVIATCISASPTTIMQWSFDKQGELEGWKKTNHVTELRVADGALRGRIMNWDPFVVAPQFQMKATPWQRVELRLKTDCGGRAQLFYSNTTESEYGGFFPDRHTNFQVNGDGEWHEYEVYPFWHTLDRIILLRLDLPKPAETAHGEKTFALDYLRVVGLGEPAAEHSEPDWDFSDGRSGWEAAKGATIAAGKQGLKFESNESASARIISPPLRCSIENRLWLHLQMKVDTGTAGYIRWVSSEHDNMHRGKFLLRSDGAVHTYNISLADYGEWSGDLLLLSVQPTNHASATAEIRRLTISDRPLGPPELYCRYIGLENAINRARSKVPLIMNLINKGGRTARNMRVSNLQLPSGVSVAGPDNWRHLPEMPPFEPVTHRLYVRSQRPVQGAIRASIESDDGIDRNLAGQMRITEAPSVSDADYVPEPQPVGSEYEIGGFYYPGWHSMAKWDPVRRDAPRRKPVLGWYDEGNPGCVDWQIKWAVEHGIKFFMVDWYWSAGSRHNEHWIKAYKQARYREYLNWCVMWANHNQPGTHSAEDQRRVTQYWIDNYFDMPEYYRIDGKPVVIIWSVRNMDRDMKGEGGAGRLLEISQNIARDAGYDGIYFMAMKWPEASTDPDIVKTLADRGFDATCVYHYMHHGGMAEDRRHFSFELVANSSYEHWKARHQADIIPFLPNLSTGWDARPWHGEDARVIYGRTPKLFRRICRDAKKFADETGIKRLAVGPLNEWGEGSYIEPCKQFGFRMYDVLRDVFCGRPADGWPPNIAPSDAGLGPYDFPETSHEMVTRWDFSDGKQGWGPFMGVTGFHAEDGAIAFETTSGDPAVGVSVHNVPADDYATVTIRMKIDNALEDERGQLFWETTTADITEATSCRFWLIGDGKYHDYVLKVGENARWQGRLRRLRLDPCSHSGATVSISEIRFNTQ